MSPKFPNLALVLLLLFGLVCTAARAQTREDLLRCRAIAEDPQRLACYDGLPLAPLVSRGKYQPVPLRELGEELLGYRGRSVEVVGQLVADDGGYSLLAGAPAGRNIPLDIGALPRQQRESLRQNCAAGCAATVQGRVAPVRFVTGILADAVLVR